MTLHVYAAHVQVPVLVLAPNLGALPSLPADRFSVRLDGGPPFAPSAVRREGDDPITLAVLLDAGGDEAHLLSQLLPALVRLRTVALHPQDALLLYAVDCQTIRFSGYVPITAFGVEHALRVVLGSPQLHRGSTLPVCSNSLRLWDTLSSMIAALVPETGRRVVLALTAGNDRASKTAWTALRSYAARQSVAFFAITRPEVVWAPNVSESPLWNLCSLSGGVLLPVSHAKDLPQSMETFLDMVRNRYILDFPRSNSLTNGTHTIEVQVSGAPRALVRLTGLSAPVLDQKLRDDPSTVPYLQADTPALGGRRPLAPGAPQP